MSEGERVAIHRNPKDQHSPLETVNLRQVCKQVTMLNLGIILSLTIFYSGEKNNYVDQTRSAIDFGPRERWKSLLWNEQATDRGLRTNPR